MNGGGRPRALVIEHERATPGGLVYDWLDEHGVEVEELEIDIDDREVDPTEYDLLVPLGSEFAAFDDSIAWIPRERDMLVRAHEADVPVLGICFGGQLLARALAGKSFRAERSEIGWLPVRTKDRELVPEGPWFQWHFDSFTPPPGARLIADSDAGPQAYVIGRSLGVQFHPEVTPQIMDEWVRVYRHELDAGGVDPDALLAETHRRADESRATSRRLLDTFIERVAGIRSKAA
jgi:GMP synthase-like glutamine amidotransferase